MAGGEPGTGKRRKQFVLFEINGNISDMIRKAAQHAGHFLFFKTLGLRVVHFKHSRILQLLKRLPSPFFPPALKGGFHTLFSIGKAPYSRTA